eukprot:CAMPEP_0114228962 /NCGR_PEP_ID=MMETSP0058-20121206/2640_1 /TAXON_ID=36894 /ORGANISM="Pyramimonas parkeae, CCMP726" /LENGTH=87 /DNA_ID=CAMNT_0001339979 /DNA_START=724 /DNA_END=986 /DNA_ORIENTATION=+
MAWPANRDTSSRDDVKVQGAQRVAAQQGGERVGYVQVVRRAQRLHLIGQSHVGAEEMVPGHGGSCDASHHWPRVQPDANLEAGLVRT